MKYFFFIFLLPLSFLLLFFFILPKETVANNVQLLFLGVPVVKDIPIKIPKLTVQTEPQPYPVNVFVSKPVPYEVSF